MHGRFAPLNWVQWVSLLTAAAVAVVMPFLVLRLENAHRETNDSIRTILCYFERRTLINPTLTATQKRQGIRLYNDALAQLAEPPCD